MEDKLLYDLQTHLEGPVRFDPLTRRVYSVDASICEVEPKVICIPKHKKDLLLCMEIARAHNTPITPRGAATGISGGALGSGVVVDLSQFLHRILHIDVKKGLAICEPGVVQNVLNEAVAPHRLRLGADTSTGDRATLGGMLANNAAGAHSLVYGSMKDSVESVRLLLSSGKEITENPFVEEMAALSREYPPFPRCSSGYNLLEAAELPKLVAGSEGSLGITTELTVKLVPQIRGTTLFVLFYHSMQEAFADVGPLLAQKPAALELLDHHILSAAGKRSWIEGEPKAALLVDCKKKPSHSAFYAVAAPDAWNVRKEGLGLLLSKRDYQRAVAFIEDLALPPEKLPTFFEEFSDLMRQKGLHYGLYGHAGAGCLHIRPYMDLRKQEEREKLQETMQAVVGLLRRYEGVLSGEHGDGLVRSWILPKSVPKKIYKDFCTIKSLFDPLNLCNPGKIVDGKDLLPYLKPEAVPRKTELDFSQEGGFALSVDLCNGNALCRKREGVMCPSFQATNDEYQSTRARAQALRREPFSSKALYKILENCVGCKGCKTECPSSVDMAKMKTEALYHYYKRWGMPFRDRLFAHLPSLLPLVSKLPTLSNWMQRWLPLSPLLLPKLQKPRAKWPQDEEPTVALFLDTFTHFFEPSKALDAYALLRKLGHRVTIIPWNCCGRTLLSKGQIPQARKKARKLLQALKPYNHLPLVGLEPSCILTLSDEYSSLLPHLELPECMTLDRFLATRCPNIQELPLRQSNPLLHIHCHQKSVESPREGYALLQTLPAITPELIQTGCCGMAGSFGYEREHREMAEKIANLHLIPAILKADPARPIIASGFSCAQQIQQMTGRKTLHMAEFLLQISYGN